MIWNIALPPVNEWKFTPLFEGRNRIERRIDKDFEEANSDNSSNLQSRYRIGGDFSYGKNLKGKFVHQYTNTRTMTIDESTDEYRSDMLFGYFDLKTSAGTVRAGRQPYVKGSGRLWGGSSWGATGRSFDGVRWTQGKWDAFGAHLAVNSTPNARMEVAGLSYGDANTETAVYYKNNPDSALDDYTYTLDHLRKSKGKRWSTEFEVALQTGKTGGKDIEAFAGVARGTFQSTSNLNLTLEANIASGGGDDDTTNTFDQLYASNHERFGVIDMQGWRNVKSLSFIAQYKPNKETTLYGEAHKFFLFDKTDAWYGDGGKSNKGSSFTFKDATGMSGDDVGSEVNFWGTYAVSKSSTLEAGLGVFMPGDFIKSFSGAGDRNLTWGYVTINIKL